MKLSLVLMPIYHFAWHKMYSKHIFFCPNYTRWPSNLQKKSKVFAKFSFFSPVPYAMPELKFEVKYIQEILQIFDIEKYLDMD